MQPIYFLTALNIWYRMKMLLNPGAPNFTYTYTYFLDLHPDDAIS